MQIIVCKLVVLLFGQNNKAPKPKQCLSATGTNKMLQHAGRIMKLTAVLLLGVCMQIYAAGYGQRITLSERDVPIEKVLKKIQQQTTYKFLYTSQLLQRVPKVTVVVKDATVEDVLELVLKGQMLDYEVSEGTVVIRAKKEAPVKETTQADLPDPIEIRGVITDENGAPASGVNIAVKGTNKGTTTNLRGEFVLRDVSENAILLITSVGYDRQEILVKGKDVISTQLRVAVGNLDEMQVIAYGKSSKRFQTGNVSTVKAIDIEKQPVNNVLIALQGMVPGLFITSANGLPGAGITVRIQGQNSINAGNDPLYIIDGVPYSSQMLVTTTGGTRAILGGSGASEVYAPGGNGNPLSFINYSDIESIEVLKDADATSIYGSRAANGAILITTKKGKIGKTKFDINLQTGIASVRTAIDMMNTQQYIEMRREALRNDGITTPSSTDYDINGLWDTTKYTDWRKVLIGRTAKYTNLTTTISGGSGSTTYLIGATYQRQTTVFPGNFSDNKGSVHFNLNSSSYNQKFKFQLSSLYLSGTNKLPQLDLTATSYSLAPHAPDLYNSLGILNWAPNANGNSSWQNPLSTTLNKYENKTRNLISNAVLSYQILRGLEIISNIGFTQLQTKEFGPNYLSSFPPETLPYSINYASYSNSSITTWIVEPQATYKLSYGSNKVNLLVGSTIQETVNDGNVLIGGKFNSDALVKDIRQASIVLVSNTVAATYKYNAVFGRVNYNLKDRYIAQISVRRDGSSRFGEDNKFHNFGSGALAWVFSEEKFMKSFHKIISFGKIKGSYGTTGGDQIGDYSYLDLYAPTSGIAVPYQGVSGLSVTGLPNTHLQWEETKKASVGFDLGLYRDRILLSSTYSNNRSSNQLLTYALPILTGSNGIVQNFPATVQNTNLEICITSKNVEGKVFNWTSSANLTIPKNKLLSFPNIDLSTYSSGLNGVIVGQPIGVVKAFNFVGVDPSSGVYQFDDGFGGVTTRPDTNSKVTQSILINKFPKFYGGFSNTFSYGQLHLDLLIQFVKQIGNSAVLFGYNGIPGTFNNNQPDNIVNRWQKPGETALLQKYSSDFRLFSNRNNANNSNYAYSDASFIRIKNISLSYELPKRLRDKLKASSVKLYMHCQNLLTITSFEGLDPETQNFNLPPLRTITFGLQVNL